MIKEYYKYNVSVQSSYIRTHVQPPPSMAATASTRNGGTNSLPTWPCSTMSTFHSYTHRNHLPEHWMMQRYEEQPKMQSKKSATCRCPKTFTTSWSTYAQARRARSAGICGFETCRRQHARYSLPVGTRSVGYLTHLLKPKFDDTPRPTRD